MKKTMLLIILCMVTTIHCAEKNVSSTSKDLLEKNRQFIMAKPGLNEDPNKAFIRTAVGFYLANGREIPSEYIKEADTYTAGIAIQHNLNIQSQSRTQQRK